MKWPSLQAVRTRRRQPCAPLLVVALVLSTLTAGACSDGVVDASVSLEPMADAPDDALVTQYLWYERIDDKQVRIEAAATASPVLLDPNLTEQLSADPFARFVHVSDVQIREERGVLINAHVSRTLEDVSEWYTPPEGTKRQSLQEANSPFVWRALVETINAIAEEWPIDFVVHTGDALDIGLRSELEHFLRIADRLQVPFLNVSGNHDVLTFGNFSTRGTLYGMGLDKKITVHESNEFAFLINQECLVVGQHEFAQACRDIEQRVGPHGPTSARWMSICFGFDLAPEPDLLYYTVQVRAPGATTPGLQLVVLETSREDAGHAAQIGDTELDWLNDVLDADATRRSLVIVCAHHPVTEMHRGDDMLGAVEGTSPSRPMAEVRAMLDHYPNVVLYLCGHTHLPSVFERVDDTTHELKWIQLDAGSLLIAPQEASLMELALDGADVEIRAWRFAPMLGPESPLGLHVEEGRLAASRDHQSAPRYQTWKSYVGRRPLPGFPVSVPRYAR